MQNPISEIQSTQNQPNNLTFYLPESRAPLSISPLDSDLFSNLIIMEQIIGTLVKYSGSGRYEPYLAKNWVIRDKGKNWEFVLRSDILDSNGDLIDAFRFRSSLIKLLELYRRNSNPPVFSNLVGWNEFCAGQAETLGIYAKSSDTISFVFDQYTDGLLEFLAMPYYGFYGESDFLMDGSWAGRDRIITSGSYDIDSWDEKGIKINLLKRNVPFLDLSKSPNRVTFEKITSNFSESLGGPSKVIARFNREIPDYVIMNDFTQIKTTPTLLTYFSLSPHLPPFDKIENRQLFQKKLYIKIRNILSNNHNIVKANDGFYAGFIEDQNSRLEKIDDQKTIFYTDEVSLVLSTKRPSDSYLNAVLTSLSELGLKTKLIEVDTTDKAWWEKIRTNRHYHGRFSSVDIGTYVEIWSTKMMFCSDLGTTFPDPDDQICQMIKSFEVSNNHDLEKFALDFENTVFNQASVYPLYRAGQTWLFSKDIDTSNLSSTMGLPRVDELTFIR